MPAVSRAALPPQSLLNGFIRPDDHVDCHCCPSRLGVDEAAARAMDFPGWVMLLLGLRNIAVAPLGLIGRPGGRQGRGFPAATALGERADPRL